MLKCNILRDTTKNLRLKNSKMAFDVFSDIKDHKNKWEFVQR